MGSPAFLSLLSLRSEAPASRHRVIDAVYADGVLRPVEPLAVEDGSTILVTVLPAGQAQPAVEPFTDVPEPPLSHNPSRCSTRA